MSNSSESRQGQTSKWRVFGIDMRVEAVGVSVVKTGRLIMQDLRKEHQHYRNGSEQELAIETERDHQR